MRRFVHFPRLHRDPLHRARDLRFDPEWLTISPAAHVAPVRWCLTWRKAPPHISVRAPKQLGGCAIDAVAIPAIKGPFDRVQPVRPDNRSAASESARFAGVRPNTGRLMQIIPAALLALLRRSALAVKKGRNGGAMFNAVIAECDETGSIAWVWVMTKDARHARPFDPDRDTVAALRPFEAHGAPRRKIADWLTRMETQRAALATA